MESAFIFKPLTISKLYVVLLALSAVFLGGCKDNRPEGMPKLHSVEIKFTQDGKPCEGASVTLSTETPSKWPVGGTTDSSGVSRPMTYGEFPGVPEGKYKILISKILREKIGKESTSMYESQAEESYDLIDPKYKDSKNSELEIEVVPGKNSFGPFELGPAVKEIVKKPGQ